MKRIMWLVALMLVAFTVTPATADFYVIAGGGRLGTAITTVPIAITSPGLYYLTNNLTISDPDLNAITVGADDVTIDLMGFCLTGPGKGSGSNNSGIRLFGIRSNVEIRNGSIKAFGGDGLKSGTGGHFGIRVVGLRTRDNGGNGLAVIGTGNLVMDCTAMNVGGTGIIGGAYGLVKGSQVVGSSQYGIEIGVGSTALGNSVKGSTLGGISALDGSLVTDNTVSNNSATGISVQNDCTITRNTAYSNTGTGIATGTYCTITNNFYDAPVVKKGN